MSLKAKGETKKSQKYHNKTAYEVRFNQRKLEINARAPLDHLCARCMEQVKWKIQYGKYKPKTSLSRCNVCKEKNIDKAYRTVCDKCADKDKVCSKCGQSKAIMQAPAKENKDKDGVDHDQLRKMEEYMEELRERSKRTIMRKLMKGEIEFHEDGYFISVEDGKPLGNIRFKSDLDEMDDNWEDNEDDDFDDDDEDFDDEDEDDEEEHKEVGKKGKNNKNKEEVIKKEVEEIKETKTEEPKKVTFKEPAKGNKGKNEQVNNKKKPQKKKEESEDDDDFDDDDEDDDDF